MTRIDLALVDDWELRGDGSGDPRRIQFEPMQTLMRILEGAGVRGSFNVEVMQQMVFRRWQTKYSTLGELADEWDRTVVDAYRRGHDIQLHIHPQWRHAEYDGSTWSLQGDWALPNHSRAAVDEMIVQGIQYLEALIRPLDSSYRCISFRSGSWAIAPSEFVLSVLASHGIEFDMSLVAGVRYHTRRVELDYTQMEEPFRPYFPDMRDARRVSPTRQPIAIVPTNRFLGQSPVERAIRNPRLVIGKLKGFRETTGLPPAGPTGMYREWDPLPDNSAASLSSRVGRFFRRPSRISDLAQLNFASMREMLRQMRNNAARIEDEAVPVILENHTKDVSEWRDIERFVVEVSRAHDIRTVTLTGIARGLRDGRYSVLTRT